MSEIVKMDSITNKPKRDIASDIGKILYDMIDEEPAGHLCFSVDVQDKTVLLNVLEKLCVSSTLPIRFLKIHPEIIKGWSHDVLEAVWLWCRHYRSDIDKPVLIWADMKFCDVPHIMCRQLRSVYWADIITIMSVVATSEILEELNRELQELDTYAFIVPTLHTNGKRLWQDPDTEKLNGITTSKYSNIVGSVGLQLPGLLYIKAGVSDGEELKDVDVVVRGRSMLAELL